MCSAIRWEADTSSRDCFHWNYLCLRHLKHVSHARLQMLAHSCYHSKWHAAFFLQEAFYSEPLLADSSCWIEMTVSSVRSHLDLFQKRKPKTNIDANFGIMFNFHFISNQLYIISEKKNGHDLDYCPPPFPVPSTHLQCAEVKADKHRLKQLLWRKNPFETLFNKTALKTRLSSGVNGVLVFLATGF